MPEAQKKSAEAAAKAEYAHKSKIGGQALVEGIMMKEKILKPLGKIFTVLKVVCVILLILLVGVLALQRFSNNEVAIGGFRVFNVATGSMIPKYQIGENK